MSKQIQAKDITPDYLIQLDMGYGSTTDFTLVNVASTKREIDEATGDEAVMVEVEHQGDTFTCVFSPDEEVTAVLVSELDTTRAAA